MPGTPLVVKLGFKPDMTVVVFAAPAGYRDWLGELPEGVVLTSRAGKVVAAAHVFSTKRADLEKRLVSLRARLEP